MEIIKIYKINLHIPVNIIFVPVVPSNFKFFSTHTYTVSTSSKGLGYLASGAKE